MAKTSNLDRAKDKVKEMRRMDSTTEPKALTGQEAQTFALLAIAELLDELVDATVEQLEHR